MRVIPNYNSLFHRCVSKQYPPKPRTVEDCSKLIVPYMSSFQGKLELPLGYWGADPIVTLRNIDTDNNPTYHEFYSVLDSNEDAVLLMENYPPNNSSISYSEAWGNSSSVSWETSTLKTYLNTTYLNHFGDHLKKFIVETEFGKVFLLSEEEVCNKEYFKYKQFREIFNLGTSVDWWLRDYSSSGKAKCVSMGNITSKNVTDSLQIRPVFWIKKSYLLDDYITPLYNQSVEYDHLHRLCIREQYSNHNEPISKEDLYRAYEKIKPNIAIYSSSEDSFTYYFPFRKKKYIEHKQQEGIYITSKMVCKVLDGAVIEKYSFRDKVGMLFYCNSLHEEGILWDTPCIYIDCYYDLDPIVWKCLPYLSYWLGDVIPDFLNNSLNNLKVTFSQYI